ncbi:YibE/F-like protein [Enterococcus faecium]|uniref:YibE/F-like protein n=8 Tax=Enterococcus TaxID=1350 RepID=A0A6N3AR40_ENTFC
MQKKISIIITLFFICILASWFIQRQAALYDVPVIEIERVRIEEDQQLITGRLMNTDQKGEVISLSAPYQKNQIETANITTRQIYLVQMHGDEWQLVAKKNDGWLFFFTSIFIGTMLLIGGKQGVFALGSLIVNIVLLLLLLLLFTKTEGISLLNIAILFVVIGIIVSILALDGWNRSSIIKISAAVTSVFLAFFICLLTMNHWKDQGLRYEELNYLTRPYRSVFLSSVLIGTAGGTLDTVITVIATLEELTKQQPKISAKQLWLSGRQVGRDVIGSMANILLFVYISGAIPIASVIFRKSMVFQRNGRTTFIIRIFTRHCWQLRNSIINPHRGPLFSRCKEVKKMNVLIILVGIFAISVLFVGGTQGMYILLGLFINLGIFFLLLFGYHQKWPILVLSIIGFLLIAVVILFFINGYNLKMRAAFASILIFLFCFLLLIPITDFLAIQGFTSIELEELSGLDKTLAIDFRLLARSLLLISLSGAVLDASVAISSGTFEVYQANPHLSFNQLRHASFAIAKKILASTVMTLLFAFMGSSLALILWFIDLDIPFQQIINEKSFVLEYTMAILTTLAALLVLPLTCVTTAYLFTKKKEHLKME